MSAADRLIADRGHGLGERQRDLLAAVARWEVFRMAGPPFSDIWQPSDMSPPAAVTQAMAPLRRFELVTLDGEVSEPAIAGGEQVRMWDVTTEGRTLLARMGSTR